MNPPTYLSIALDLCFFNRWRAAERITYIQYSDRMVDYNDKLDQLHASMEINCWRLSRMDRQPNEAQYSSFRKCTKKGKERECCMCGDLGFQERLFRCHRCHHRLQHIYCSRLYSDQLEPDGVNVCDWCLDLEAKQKIQRHKRKFELQEMESRKANEVSSIDKSKKGNTKPTFKPHVKFGGSKHRQQSSLIQDCKLSVKSCRNLPGTHRPQSSPTKSGLARRYKLLSDVIC